MLVREKMNANVISVNISDTLAKAEKLMQQNKIHHLPVFSGTKLTAMISSSDTDQFKLRKPDADLAQIAVREIVPANQRLITIAPDVSIEQAVTLMQNNKIGSLPVMAGDKMIGVITLSDVLNTFLDLLWNKRSRISVELGQEPGLIAEVATVIGNACVSIQRIVMFPRPETNSYEALISLDTDDTAPIVAKLKQKGYTISDS